MPATLYETTRRRLTAYKQFSDETIEAIALLAGQQSQFKTYQEYFNTRGGLLVSLHVRRRKDGVPVVDVPAREKPVRGTLVVHLPMANPLDPNQRFQIATLADANPHYRVIGFGNPSHKPFKYSAQNQTPKSLFAIAAGNNKRPLVAAEVEYLESQNTQNIIHVGYSYGAHKALIAANYTHHTELKGIVLIDPVAHARSLRQLVSDFKRTFTDLGKYVNRTEQPLFLEARRDSGAKESDLKKYLRPINIAIALLLARADFVTLLKNVMNTTHAPIAVAWGTKSELGNDAHLRTVLAALAKNPQENQLRRFRLEGDSHAFANDIYLHAALVREAVASFEKN